MKHDSARARAIVVGYQRQMTTGQRCDIDADLFEQAFPSMSYDGYHWSSADRFMENQIGSSYGTWSVRHNRKSGFYTIIKGEEGEHRVWTSPDRRHLVPPEQRGGWYDL